MAEMETYEILVIGGGPAGLSASLVLGRCRRRVCIVDSGHGRNERAHSAHGIFTRDGATPAELRAMGRAQLAPYDVTVHEDEVVAVAANQESPAFIATTRSGRVIAAQKLLLASGMRDRVPDRPGLRERFGRGVHVCPYCDGWENRDRPLVAYGTLANGAPDLALGLLTWSDDVVLVTTGERVTDEDRERLERNGIVIHEDDVRAVEGDGDGLHLRAVVLASGARLERDVMFLKFGEEQASPFARELGCELAPNNTVHARDGERAGRPGVFVAGDASHDLQLVAVAIAEGVKAACAINTELRREAQSARRPGP